MFLKWVSRGFLDLCSWNGFPMGFLICVLEMGFLICVLELLVESWSNFWKCLSYTNSHHVVSWVLGVFLCVWVVFGTFNSRTLHSCSLISYTFPLLSLTFCFYCIWVFLAIFNWYKLILFVSFWFLNLYKLSSHVSPKMSSILCSTFLDNIGWLLLFECSFIFMFFLSFGAFYF